MASFESIFFNPVGHNYPEGLPKGYSPPLHKSPDYIRQQHRMFFNDPNLTVHRPTKLSYTTTHKIEASTTSIKQLKRISLQDLHMEEATKGGYLVLRTIEPSYRMVAITTIVEDHEGNAVLFALYNFCTDFSPSSADLFPVGTIFILKEPYIKMSLSKDCMLRCDCPTDMIILHEGHELFNLLEDINWKNTPNPDPINPVSKRPRPDTAIGWKDRGNALFMDGKYEYATQCYLLALQEAEKMNNFKDSLIMHLNLSAAYLQREFFEAALGHSRTVLGFEPGNPKALLRAGRCCYQLRNYNAAMQYFEVFHKLYPDYESGTREMDECKSRVSEQETGEFNVYKMYLERIFKPGQKIDCADYVGPVKVVEIAGKGRGVVATRDLKPGTLIVVSKALAFSWEDANEILLQFTADQTTQFANNMKLVSEVTQAVAKNPNTFGPMVYDLFDGQPKVAGNDAHLFCDPKTKQEPIADVHKIRKILDINCFMSLDEFRGIDGRKYSRGCGLFVFPSYFNHSCLPNANWLMFNDVMFVRVRQFTKTGQEILISYFPWENGFEVREDLCQFRGFQCSCDMCSFERSMPESLTVKRLNHIWTFSNNFRTQIYAGNVNAALISRFKKLIKTYGAIYENANFTFPNVDKLTFYSFLAKAHKCQGNYKEEIKCLKNVVGELGFNVEQLLASLENGTKLKMPKNAMLCQALLYYF